MHRLIIGAATNAVGGLIPNVAPVMQNPATVLVTPFVSVGLYAGFKVLVGSQRK